MKNLIAFLFILYIFNFLLNADGVQPLGSGTEEDPYQVETLDNLLWISTNPDSWSSHFIQIADIDASETTNWNDGEGFSPIGELDTPAPENPFTGNYNGAGYTIDQLYINRSSTNNIGLFGRTIGSAIQNLGLTNVNFTGGYWVGSLVGLNRNSIICNSFGTGNVVGINRVGGLIGRSSGSIVTNCYSSGNVFGIDEIGGLVGMNYHDSEINNSISESNVDGEVNIGGLVGFNYSSSSLLKTDI